MTTEKRRRRAAAGLGTLLLCACLPAHAEPAAWVVKDADSTIYLFGTVHLLKPDLQWETPSVRRLVAESTELWLEIGEQPDPAVFAPLVQRFAVDPQRPLSQKLTAEQYTKLQAVAARYGLPPAQLEPLKPWFVALTLAVLPMQQAGHDPNAGADMRLRAAAVADGDAIRGLESFAEQFALLDALPEALQIEMLVQTVEDDGEALARMERAAAAWARGDLETIDAELLHELRTGSPALYEAMLTRRNAAWAERIATLLQGAGTHLVAVGAGHLIGAGSVQDHLQQRGIASRRLAPEDEP